MVSFKGCLWFLYGFRARVPKGPITSAFCKGLGISLELAKLSYRSSAKAERESERQKDKSKQVAPQCGVPLLNEADGSWAALAAEQMKGL